MLRSIRKEITKEQMENAVIQSLEVGIQPGGNFMIGHPEDTEETIRETVEFAKLLKSYGADIDLAITTPFPGTYLSNHADELGVEILSDEWSDFRLDNPPNHLFKGEIANLCWTLPVLRELSRIKLSAQESLIKLPEP